MTAQIRMHQPEPPPPIMPPQLWHKRQMDRVPIGWVPSHMKGCLLPSCDVPVCKGVSTWPRAVPPLIRNSFQSNSALEQRTRSSSTSQERHWPRFYVGDVVACRWVFTPDSDAAVCTFLNMKDQRGRHYCCGTQSRRVANILSPLLDISGGSQGREALAMWPENSFCLTLDVPVSICLHWEALI